MQRLEEFERKEEEEAARERAKQEMLVAEAKKAAKKKEEEEFKKRVIAEAEREKYENELKEKKKKEEEDRIFKARLKEMYLAQGYSEESIEMMIQDAENKRRGSHGGHSPHSPHALTGHEGAMTHLNEQMKVYNLSKPTYLKVRRKHLSPDTLDLYGLPWEWDDVSFAHHPPPPLRFPFLPRTHGFFSNTVGKGMLTMVTVSTIRISSSSNNGSTRTFRTSCLNTNGS